MNPSRRYQNTLTHPGSPLFSKIFKIHLVCSIAKIVALLGYPPNQGSLKFCPFLHDLFDFDLIPKLGEQCSNR